MLVSVKSKGYTVNPLPLVQSSCWSLCLKPVEHYHLHNNEPKNELLINWWFAEWSILGQFPRIFYAEIRFSMKPYTLIYLHSKCSFYISRININLPHRPPTAIPTKINLVQQHGLKTRITNNTHQKFCGLNLWSSIQTVNSTPFLAVFP